MRTTERITIEKESGMSRNDFVKKVHRVLEMHKQL